MGWSGSVADSREKHREISVVNDRRRIWEEMREHMGGKRK